MCTWKKILQISGLLPHWELVWSSRLVESLQVLPDKHMTYKVPVLFLVHTASDGASQANWSVAIFGKLTLFIGFTALSFFSVLRFYLLILEMGKGGWERDRNIDMWEKHRSVCRSAPDPLSHISQSYDLII